MVTLTGKHTVDLDHARALAKDACGWEAEIEALLQEGASIGKDHLSDTDDRFGMVISSLTNIYIKEGR